MTNDSLLSLQKLFTDRVFRIPDYQRGYAWGERQLQEFWDDLQALRDGRVHYTGLVMLEPVPREVHETWERERWLIRDRGYAPVHVVDGQQRLTTSVILSQVIAERIGSEGVVATRSAKDIRTRYVCLDGHGVTKAYVFGYEKDDPSDEFLRTHVFGDPSHTDEGKQTLYTRNLANAKAFFESRVEALDQGELDTLFRKLTQDVRFNVFIAGNELDASVIFETMNYRGKQLSTLELLKNRLIHLAAQLGSDEAASLRRSINGAWKEIYGYLGRNPSNPLDDESFVRAHHISYFEGQHRSKERAPARDDLLKNRFTLARLREGKISGTDIEKYTLSLKEAGKRWFLIHNPHFEASESEVARERDRWLERIHRLGLFEFGPLLVSLPLESPSEELNGVLAEIERFIFVVFRVSRRRANTGRNTLFRYANEHRRGVLGLAALRRSVSRKTEDYTDIVQFDHSLSEWFARRGIRQTVGYYAWPGLRYLLYEYESHLQARMKGNKPKIRWDDLKAQRAGFVTVEHVYPRNPVHEEWPTSLSGRTPTQRRYLCNSLGNLIPLSVPKNSALGNKSFEEKKAGSDEWPGYRFGSYSEIEVAQNEEWGADQIVRRGLDILSFMEKRWGVDLGDKDNKLDLLYLRFTRDQAEHTASIALASRGGARTDSSHSTSSSHL